jgi:hypothetical protein
MPEASEPKIGQIKPRPMSQPAPERLFGNRVEFDLRKSRQDFIIRLNPA